MFENYYQQLGSNILSSSYDGLISVSSKSDHLLTTFAFDNHLQNPRATAVFTEKIGIFGISNDEYETAASYTYKSFNDSGRFRPTISFLQKSDMQTVKVHIPYTINFNNSHSLKIFASDEIFLNEKNDDDESFNQANNSQGRHLFSLSAKSTHQFYNGKITTEETLKILPQFFFATIFNYSGIVFDAFLSKSIQQIKWQYAYENILYFSQLVHVYRLKNPYKYNIGFLVTDPHTMLGFYFTQIDVVNCMLEEEEEDVGNTNANSYDIADVFKVKIMHKQNNFKIASKFNFDDSLKVIPKVGIELKLNSNKVVFGANGKFKEAFFKYEMPFGKRNNNICTLNASFNWINKTFNKVGISLQLNH